MEQQLINYVNELIRDGSKIPSKMAHTADMVERITGKNFPDDIWTVIGDFLESGSNWKYEREEKKFRKWYINEISNLILEVREINYHRGRLNNLVRHHVSYKEEEYCPRLYGYTDSVLEESYTYDKDKLGEILDKRTKAVYSKCDEIRDGTWP